MAKKPKNTAADAAGAAAPAATAPARDLLGEAVVALNTNVPMQASQAEMQALIGDSRGPLVEFNDNVKFDGDKIAFRATELGRSVWSPPQASQPSQPMAWGTPAASVPSPQPNAAPQSQPQTQTIQPGDVAKLPTGPRPTVTFDDNIPVPAPRRGGKGSGVYGFETMVVGQSFFIAATADNPNPAKRIASTVSSASKRNAPNSYIVRSVDETPQGRGKGARVWRTA